MISIDRWVNSDFHWPMSQQWFQLAKELAGIFINQWVNVNYHWANNQNLFPVLDLVWFSLVSWDINYCRLFITKSILYINTVPFQTIQFSKSTQISSIWTIDRTLSGATTLGQNGPGSNGNKWALCIPQSSNIIGASSSDCSVSYTGHSLGENYPSAEMHSVYSLVPAN